jgi:hypothetical protein
MLLNFWVSLWLVLYVSCSSKVGKLVSCLLFLKVWQNIFEPCFSGLENAGVEVDVP